MDDLTSASASSDEPFQSPRLDRRSPGDQRPFIAIEWFPTADDVTHRSATALQNPLGHKTLSDFPGRTGIQAAILGM